MYRVTYFLNIGPTGATKEPYYTYWYERPEQWDLGRLCVKLPSTSEKWWTYSSSTMIEVPDDV